MKIRVAWLHKSLSVALVSSHVDKCRIVSQHPAQHCGSLFLKSQLCWLLLKLREVDNWSPAQDCVLEIKMWFSVVGRTESVVSFYRVLPLMFLCKR